MTNETFPSQSLVCVDDRQQAITLGETQSDFRAEIFESDDLIEIGNLIIGELVQIYKLTLI